MGQFPSGSLSGSSWSVERSHFAGGLRARPLLQVGFLRVGTFHRELGNKNQPTVHSVRGQATRAVGTVPAPWNRSHSSWLCGTLCSWVLDLAVVSTVGSDWIIGPWCGCGARQRLEHSADPRLRALAKWVPGTGKWGGGPMRGRTTHRAVAGQGSPWSRPDQTYPLSVIWLAG